jgi:molecular chaperone GrpE (heat shock protein)
LVLKINKIDYQRYYICLKSQSNESKLDRSNSRSNSQVSSKKLSCSESVNKKSPLVSSTDSGYGKQSRTKIQELPSVDTGVQTQQEDLEETNYVKELKNQLEILKNEITRLQNAQSNLEKSLKQTTTAFRPFMYTGGFGDQADIITDYSNLEQYITLDPSFHHQFSQQKAITGAPMATAAAQTSQGAIKEAVSAAAMAGASVACTNSPKTASTSAPQSQHAMFVDTNSLLLQQPFIYDSASLKDQFNDNIYNLNQFNVNLFVFF